MPGSRGKTPTVGIGASAGGVDALERLFKNTPTDTGLAFVIVTHLAPDRESLLPEIVARFTPMPVLPVRDGQAVEANHVYVLPENALIDVADGVLHLRPLDPARRERKPIDIFLASLARDCGEYCAGIVLSGGDGDGTLGVKAVKERGGLTLAQVGDGGGPAHPDMPQSAIVSGMIDFAVPAEEMGARLADFARSLEALDGDDPARSGGEDRVADARPEIYRLLRAQIGHDFSGYKTRTFNRRVQRRMQVCGLETTQGYLERLEQDSAEVAALFRDLLINVTNFFRDEDAFKALERLVIPRLFEGRSAEDTVRVWVPGCATGEEVYSIAILMREFVGTLRGAPRVQIFATDIDETSLSAARAGRYPDALLDTVSPERRERFFTADGGSFVVAKEVRDLCIFSPHSVIRDPPFTRMDLVSCRNLLIYFGAAVQDQVIPTFHYALRPNGYLFLGSSENVSQQAELFAPVEKAHRIFRSRDDGRSRPRIPSSLSPQHMSPAVRMNAAVVGQGMPLRQTVEHHVLERIAPPHVVVNAEGDVVYYSTRTGKYLEAAPGAPSRSVLALAKKALKLELRTALRDAMDRNATVVRDKVPLEAEDDRVQLVNITVDPMSQRSVDEPLFLISFTDVGPALSRHDALNRTHGHSDEAIANLEHDLQDTRDRLQSMIEEYETTLEELKSSNEELVSVNEELQSTNEELESSKEELQSLNEELQTVNAELSLKVDALDQSNNDLHNLFDSTQIATIFLDRHLQIRTFTPAISFLFNILPSDKGRSLTDFSGRLNYPELADDVKATLVSGRPLEQKVEGEDRRSHYLVRLRPYAGADGAVDGVVITFIDVSEITASEARQRVLIAELNHRVKNMLAVAVGVVRQTAKGAQSAPAFADAIVSRLESMARSYELLSQESWGETRVSDLAARELAPFGFERVRLEGADVMLKPEQALSLGMVLHELTTNAVKYGALSNIDGRIAVTWRTEDDGAKPRLKLSWTETGGPAVEETSHRGFGLKLVERETAHGLQGAAHIHWRPEGVHVVLEAPVA